MSSRSAFLAGAAALAVATAAGGAVRARLGGTLAIGLLGLSPPSAGALADAPEAASARALVALPLCRLEPLPVPVLAAASRRHGAGPEEVAVSPLPDARFPDGTPLGAGDIAQSWRRLGAAGGGAYLGLLAPVASLDGVLEAAGRRPEEALVLPLAYPWPDLDASLCHPALTPSRGPEAGLGLYARDAGGRLSGWTGLPRGAPFPQALSLTPVLARTASRLLRTGEVRAVLGEPGGTEPGPLLFATYLAYHPGRLPPGALATLGSLDVAELLRTFVPGPAVPMPGLLPPSLTEPPLPPRAAPPRAPPTPAPALLTLGYDAALAEHGAVAERLQVKLHDAGYRVRLQGLDRAGLARARAEGSLDAALVSVLLPPLPAPALAVVLALAEQPQLLAQELPPLGALADPDARRARVRERLAELQGALPLVPLYARGLRVRLGPTLVDARRDAFGLLVLDDAWLTE